MKIVVCIKWVPDPEAPATAFSVDPGGKIKVADYIPWMFGPYEENAIEAALQIKDKIESQIVLLCFGPSSIEEQMREVLGSGADMSMLVHAGAYKEADSYGAAKILAGGIEKIADVDLILCGRQASDTDAGIFGPALAEILGYSCATGVRGIEIEDDHFYVEIAEEGEVRKIKMQLPGVVTVTSEKFTLRYSTMPNIMAAMEKEVTVLGLPDMGLSDENCSEHSLTQCLGSDIPHTQINCVIIEGQDDEEKAVNLVKQLAADKLV